MALLDLRPPLFCQMLNAMVSGGMPFVDKVLKVMFDDLPYNLTSKRKNYFSKINFISGI